ncbi:PolC-type DNA polymerase III [Gemella sp. GH3]|uniref:PolC-type DNA polymerase III n=1 Tax=unclassified Gemella TaxID=2624949 RepID=UPI0015CFC5BD|nr:MULTISPECIES: PolC-type DNA polymerase III [unclassified Gemella]MBF0714193.1 PolC-type DNA polymerase III [Gemella sp. GH3.1]NYS51145.1 PolC-type DNA polymerase III [Gemella sp. GH3]
MSNKNFSFLLKVLDLEYLLEKRSFSNMTLENIVKNNTDKEWIFNFKVDELPLVTNWILLINKMRDSFFEDYLVNYSITVNNEVKDEKILEYWPFVINEVFFTGENNAIIDAIIANEIIVDNSEIIVKVFTPTIWSNFIDNKKDEILKIYKNLGIVVENIRANFKNEELANKHEQIISEEISRLEKIKDNSQKKVQESNGSTKKIDRYGKTIKDQNIVEIKDIVGYSGSATLLGQVFDTEKIDFRSGSSQFRIKITDYSDSIIVRMFINSNNSKFKNSSRKNGLVDILSSLKKGQWIKIEGNVSYDTFLNDTVIEPRAIESITKEEKLDDYEGKKRIELNVHTKMSPLDGVSSAKEYLDCAEKWGHEAIAFTDSYGVQAYPEICLNTKGRNIKPIYGLNAFILDDSITATTNKKELYLKDATYVVFDVETTGLSAERDKLIEIAAIKVKNGKEIDTFESYINPERSISQLITNITSITNEDVKNAPLEQEVMTNFYNWLDNDDILVAHNAKFDLGFIGKSFERLGIMEKLHYASIDTLFLSRAINKEAKRHGLNNLAKMYKVKLTQHHRAIFDTKATAEVFVKMLNQLYSLGIEKHNEIDDKIDSNLAHRRARSFPCSILVKNTKGLKDLFKLVSYSSTKYLSSGKPTIPRSLLNNYREDLIIGSGNSDNELFEELLNSREDKLRKLIDFYDYVEIQPLHHYEKFIKNERIKDTSELQKEIKRLIELSTEQGKIVVATGDTYYLDDYKHVYRQILRLTVKNNPGARDIMPMANFLTTKEMLDQFSYLNDKKLIEDIVINNTHKINNMIEYVVPLKDKLYTPKIEGAEEDVRNISYQKARSIYGDNLPEIIEKRLEKELDSIIGNGFSVVYLISSKLVKKSLSDGYLVGSRGSVGSSLVATMMDITEVNPLVPHYVCPNCKYSEFFLKGEFASGFDLPNKNCPKCQVQMKKDGQDIPFETFLGFKGDKVPDIDLNFSGDYQPTAHNFTKEIFGEDYVYRAGTISTVAQKTAYSFTREYFEKHEIDKRNVDLERIATGCEGVKRTTGQHPGGILVVPNDMDIFDFTPYQYPADDETSAWRTTHFDFHSIHDNILKFDILGHDDPTMIRKLQDLSGIDPTGIDVSDPDVMKLFSSPDVLGVTKEELGCSTGTLGIPEFGTNFVIQMLEDTKPTTYSELVQISGLSHGTDVWLGNAQDLIKKKICTLKDVIGCRDDIMVYLIYAGLEESLAFTIMESVRKGKGLTEDFEKAMRDNNVPEWYIDSCKKIKYMFPKAHAAAYVLMALRIAWFKVHKPIVYYCAYFSVRANDYDIKTVIQGKDFLGNKIKQLKELGRDQITGKDQAALVSYEIAFEMLNRGYKFLKVDLEKSQGFDYIIEGDSLIPPFSIVPGLGENVALKIVQAREENKFLSIEDFSKRCGVSSTVLEYLKDLGTFKGVPEKAQLSFFDDL